MKKNLLASAFALIGTFAMANNIAVESIDDQNNITVELIDNQKNIEENENNDLVDCDWCIESAWGQSYCATANDCAAAKKKATAMMLDDIAP